MRYDKFELSVTVPSNRGLAKIPEYGHAGLTLVEGRAGQAYSLKLRNDCAQRVMAVISIDGRNVVDGEVCTPDSRGYIIPAYSSVDIHGWRSSLDQVHDFYFTDKQQSYAKGAGGEVQNCGVIAAKFFSEKPSPIQWMPSPVEHHHHHHHHDHYPSWPPYWPHYPKWPYPDIICWSSTTGSSPAQYTSSSNEGPIGNEGPSGTQGIQAMYCASTEPTARSSEPMKCAVNNLSTSNVPDFKLGTGWGEAKLDQVSQTSFDRDRELCHLTIYYADAADLERVGIRLAKDLAVTPPAPVLPQAFAGFCKPPISR